LSLAEALETLFPPVWSQVERMPEPKRSVYRHIRAFLGPVAQGPAAIIARWGDTCAFATDALGLRPLWLVPTDEGLYVCSERASLPMEIFTDDPVPLAPGEKVIAQVVRGQTVSGRQQQKTPSFRFPLQAGGTERARARRSRSGANRPRARFPSRSGGDRPRARFPSRSGGNLKEGGNHEL
jgi:hypothetical protein